MGILVWGKALERVLPWWVPAPRGEADGSGQVNDTAGLFWGPVALERVVPHPLLVVMPCGRSVICAAGTMLGRFLEDLLRFACREMVMPCSRLRVQPRR